MTNSLLVKVDQVDQVDHPIAKDSSGLVSTIQLVDLAWLVVYLPLRKISSDWIIIPTIMENKTTNQYHHQPMKIYQ